MGCSIRTHEYLGLKEQHCSRYSLDRLLLDTHTPPDPQPAHYAVTEHDCMTLIQLASVNLHLVGSSCKRALG